jgi:ankyrin repeat protein
MHILRPATRYRLGIIALFLVIVTFGVILFRESILELAIVKNWPTLSELALRIGADPNYRDEDVPMLSSAAYVGSATIVHQLVSSGADINAADGLGETALMSATEGGYQDIVRFLLNNGAKIDAKNRNGDTALSIAVSHKRLDIAALIRTESKSNP